jgi:hypothetical protein
MPIPVTSTGIDVFMRSANPQRITIGPVLSGNFAKNTTPYFSACNHDLIVQVAFVRSPDFI